MITLNNEKYKHFILYKLFFFFILIIQSIAHNVILFYCVIVFAFKKIYFYNHYKFVLISFVQLLTNKY